jgi:WS/DGAT/MGAT family acyltransferase
MERLSGLDASFLYLETPTLHMHVVMAAVFDPSTMSGDYSFERVKKGIADRIPNAPVFRRRLVEVPLRLGHPVWIDDPDFDIDDHVRRAALPKPGGLLEFAEFASDVAGHQLDRSKPMWEMWLVEGLEDDNIGFVVKMHHSTVDGVAGAELLSVILDVEPNPTPPEVPKEVPGALPEDLAHDPSRTAAHEATGERTPSGFELTVQAALYRSMRPVEMARDLVRTGQRVLNVGLVRLGARETGERSNAALPLTAPRTSFNTTLTRRRNVAFTAIGLSDVKRLKNATGTTVNDVVLAVCTGALRSYLQSGNELPDQGLVAVVPVSVRSDIDAPKGSNQLSTLFVELPTHLDDPLDRLNTIHDGAKGAKAEHSALGPDMLISWAEHATPNFFTNAARLYSAMHLADRHRPIANLVASNFPGPDFPLYLGGAEMQSSFPLGPVMDGMGLNITVMTYRGVLYWGIIACPESIPSLWDLAAAVPAALEELLLAAGEGPATYRSDQAAQPAGPAGQAGATATEPPPSKMHRSTPESAVQRTSIPAGKG